MNTITVEPETFTREFVRLDPKPATARTFNAVKHWATKKVRSFSPGIAHSRPRIEVVQDPSLRVTLVVVSVDYAPLPGGFGTVVVRAKRTMMIHETFGHSEDY